MGDAFSTYHPIVNFVYFALVLLFSMCLMHPICLLISAVCALLYVLRLNGRALPATAPFLLPMVALAVLLNPLFNHRGVTILTYLPGGNPLTLESLLYGLAAGLLLATVCLWFLCLGQVITSDKLVYLFGRILPSLSLIFAMILRFLPRFRQQMTAVNEAQQGLCPSNPKSLRQAVTRLSILLTWCLENAMDTADSMKSRGYGLPGRTAFSLYTVTQRDKYVLLWLAFLSGYVALGWYLGALQFTYSPALSTAPLTPLTALFFVAYCALCSTPLILNAKEDFIWKTKRQPA